MTARPTDGPGTGATDRGRAGRGRFERAARRAAARLGDAQLRTLADRIAADWPDAAAAQAVPVPGAGEVTAALLSARRADRLSGREAAAYLRGMAAGRTRRPDTPTVESVWSGPDTHQVPVRATARVLLDLITGARRELLLMTYSARPYPPVLTALAEAARRRVAVTVVVETLRGAGGALGGPEPAAAFATVPGVSLWHWPVGRRPTGTAGGGTSPRMHAKIAIADRRVLLVSSANLTESGVSRNIEAGLLIRGGAAPERAAEHITALTTHGVLAPLVRGDHG